MNKIDTKKIKADFSKRVDAKKAWFDRMVLLNTGTASELIDLNILCESHLTSIYVEYECLVSDLFHGYINSDPKSYMSSIESKIKNSIKDKYSPWHASHTSFLPPKHINSVQLGTLLDPTDWNITFKDVDVMKMRAKEWLSSNHEKKFSSLSASDSALIDAAHALRNCIAHNSESSRKIMNSKIKAIITGVGCLNSGLEITTNGVSNMGKYLRANVNGLMRVVSYSNRIQAIGAIL
jgi:hypothetical protein